MARLRFGAGGHFGDEQAFLGNLVLQLRVFGRIDHIDPATQYPTGSLFVQAGTLNTATVAYNANNTSDWMFNGNTTVYLNNKPLREPWLPHGTALGKPIPQEKIKPGQYFMMGDNRDISCDSRYWGTVPGSAIIGKVFILWWRNGRPAFHIF